VRRVRNGGGLVIAKGALSRDTGMALPPVQAERLFASGLPADVSDMPWVVGQARAQVTANIQPGMGSPGSR